MTTFIIRASIVLGLTVVMGQSAFAKVKIRPPHEIPPESFTQSEYVDSTGCVFTRAVLGDGVAWYPRVRGNGQQMCADPPTIKEEALDDTAHEPASQQLSADPVMEMTVSCYVDLPVAQRFYLPNGGSVILCTRGDGNIQTSKHPFNSRKLQGIVPEDLSGARIQPFTNFGAQAAQRHVEHPRAQSYIQIGTYAEQDNAARALRRVENTGYEGSSRSTTIAGKALLVVAAGPFYGKQETLAALKTLRKMGYGDAFVIHKRR